MLPPKYEDDTITQYWVMAHYSCIPYITVCTRMTYFPENLVTWYGGSVVYIDVLIFEIFDHQMQISSLVAR